MKVFTTGQAATVLDISISTVSKWADSGRLHGCYRQSRYNNARRIPWKSVVRFCRQEGRPVHWALPSPFVFVTDTSDASAALVQRLTKLQVQYHACDADGLPALLRSQKWPGECVIVSLCDIHATNGMSVRRIRIQPADAQTMIDSIIDQYLSS